MASPQGYYQGFGQFPYGPVDAGEVNAQRTAVLWGVTTGLGLLTFGIGFGSPVPLGWDVGAATFAGAVAGVGLLPRQTGHGWVAVVLAVNGFLAALATLIRAEHAGWALVVIVVLNLLQAAAATSALLLEPADSGAPTQPDYTAYAQYAQAYQAYQAAQYHQVAAPQSHVEEHATAHAAAHSQAQGTVRTRGQVADAAQESYEALQNRYAQYGVHPPAAQHTPPAAQHTPPAAAPVAAGPAQGVPGYAYGGTAAPHFGTAAPHNPGTQPHNPGEAISD